MEALAEPVYSHAGAAGSLFKATAPESHPPHGYLSSAAEHTLIDSPMKEEDTAEYWNLKWKLKDC